MSQKNNNKNVPSESPSVQQTRKVKPTKITEVELDHVKKHLKTEERLILKIGELELDKINITRTQDQVIATIADRQKTFNQWMNDFIYPRYGKCEIDPKDGSIIPIGETPDGEKVSQNNVGGGQ